jgi:inorganic phosphate transporter, PiT family
MDTGLAIAVVLALVFAGTNGLHDASNSIATLVATRAARPLQAIILASIFNLLGPLLFGAAVADTIGGIVTVAPSVATEVIGSGLAAAVAWNLVTWRYGLPSSSGHALVGGLVGAGLAEGGLHAVNWGGLDGWHPVGVFGTLIALGISPPLGGLGALPRHARANRAARALSALLEDWRDGDRRGRTGRLRGRQAELSRRIARPPPSRRRRGPRQIASGSILIAPEGHSVTHIPQPLQ